ncbi:MAG: hypothetical protein E6R06_17430 [Mycobacterium sp.]|nr:MAG: hypothetical protein E6R06_17430 [Mycobacterium sp.]
MAPLLIALGASQQDMERIIGLKDRLSEDPTLPFRKSKNGRFRFDMEAGEIGRLEFQPFVLSHEEDFVRHDSGQLREFAEIGEDLQENTVLQALLRFQATVIEGVSVTPRPKLDYASRSWVCTVFHLLTISTPDLIGEPALEGVHADGVDHTMTTMLGSQNMSEDSAITFVHDNRERNGIPYSEADSQLILGSCQHRHFLDTLLVVDHERKHSVSPVWAKDQVRAATRDMLIFFTRKPTTPGHISHPYDGLARHNHLPLSFVIRRDSDDREHYPGRLRPHRHTSWTRD